MEPSEKFIMGKHEAWNSGRLVNRSIGLLFYDFKVKKFRRKSFFSYGFVNNEVEYARTDDEIRFILKSSLCPNNLREYADVLT